MSELRFSCRACSASIEYAPGTTHLKCPYCGSEQEIPRAEEPAAQAAVEELDYAEVLREAAAAEEQQEVLTVRCASCGAETTLPPNVTAGRCAFCGTPQVAAAKSKRALRPRALLPFKVAKSEAWSRFRTWVGGLWFAPSRLQQDAATGGIDGVYLPFWTYDCSTRSRYRGERGDDYHETETYTATENGRSVTRTRRVKKTRWSPASGAVEVAFDDVLVCASRSLPADKVRALEPWDLEALVPSDDAYLAGFRAESYAVGLEQGFELAKDVMEERIRAEVRRDIGGDHQRVHSLQTAYSGLSFKHVLLPLWISSYRFGGKVYRFLVNARTGEVQGERPWSWVKIAFAVLGALVVLVVLFGLLSR